MAKKVSESPEANSGASVGKPKSAKKAKVLPIARDKQGREHFDVEKAADLLKAVSTAAAKAALSAQWEISFAELDEVFSSVKLEYNDPSAEFIAEVVRIAIRDNPAFKEELDLAIHVETLINAYKRSLKRSEITPEGYIEDIMPTLRRLTTGLINVLTNTLSSPTDPPSAIRVRLGKQKVASGIADAISEAILHEVVSLFDSE